MLKELTHSSYLVVIILLFDEGWVTIFTVKLLIYFLRGLDCLHSDDMVTNCPAVNMCYVTLLV